MTAATDDKFRQAIAAFQAGKPNEAERCFKAVIQRQPTHVAALNLLSVLLTQLERWAEAEVYIKSAIKLSSNSDSTFYNYGLILKALKRPSEALEQFNQALSINPAVAETWNNRGTVLSDLGRYGDAISDFNKALEIQPNYSDAFCNKGKSLALVSRLDEALVAYDCALTLMPDLAEAWAGRGNIFTDLKRYDEALAAYDKSLSLKPGLAEAWLGRGKAFGGLNRHDEALAAYERALSLKPDFAEAWLGRGNIFLALKRYDEAFAAYDKALSLKPELAEAWLGLGNTFGDLRRHDAALAAYNKALALKPDLAEAWLGRGNVFNILKFYDEAFTAYDTAMAMKPDLTGLEGYRLVTKMHLCDWTNFYGECTHLISSVRSGKLNTQPFQFIAIPSSPEDQLQCARLAASPSLSKKSVWLKKRYNHEKLRVAYVSADFREHPVAFLIAGMLECHDRSRFDFTGVSVGPRDSSEIRQRLEGSFSRFIDADTFSDDQIANYIRSSEVDILVDLMGFTTNSRTGSFAHRPAPVQVSYLGYLGTTGANYLDYIVADQIVIPENQRRFYAEKIVYLPNSFQPTDRQRHISDNLFMRADAGLPQKGFVFCNFNTSYKITPDVFDVWMRILKQVNGSVLWIVAGRQAFESNIRSEAAARGVNPERLIFAPPMPLPEHQARVQLADLFLDTLPYNAGATASDMLWAGLPVLTRIGDTFVGRMAASLLNAIRLPELITTTPEAYERMAIDLATHPEKLAALRRKLAENRLTTPLFDTKLYTTHIELAYTMMYERLRAGLAADHLLIPG